MKKLVSIAVAGVFALFLTACGEDDKKMESDTAKTSTMRPMSDDGQKMDDKKADDMKKMQDMKKDVNGVKDGVKNMDVERGTTSGES